MLPANHAIPGLQSGSFMATHFQNGNRPKSQVRFYGFMGNVCHSLAFASTETYLFFFWFRSGCRKKRLLVREILDFYLRNLSCLSALQ